MVGKDIVTTDGKLHLDDPKIKEAVIKALDLPDDRLPRKVTYRRAPSIGTTPTTTTPLISKLIVMDIDGTISTEVAIIKNKEDYDDIVTMGMPLSNDGKPIASQLTVVNALIPTGAKNVAVAKDFLKYFIQPKVNNEWLKVGLGRNIPVMPSVAKNDPWWLADPHRKAYTEQGVFGEDLPGIPGL